MANVGYVIAHNTKHENYQTIQVLDERKDKIPEATLTLKLLHQFSLQ
jgi:hypothetical protein